MYALEKQHSYIRNLSHILPIFCLLIGSCDKEATIDVNPRINIISTAPDTLIAFQDSLSITIAYTDGDGDIGHPDPNYATILLQDSRVATPESYALLPLLLPDSLPKSINGNIHLKTRPTFVLGNDTLQTFQYSITLKDQNGHNSNTILTPQIIVIK